jgi:competence protein ComEA
MLKVCLILLAGISLGLLSGYLLFYSPLPLPDAGLSEDSEFSTEGEQEDPARGDGLQDAALHLSEELPPVPEKASLMLPSEVNSTVRKDLCISVEGAVRKPGVYYFEKDSRVNDAILAAGGLQENADLSDINLAAWVLDNVPLYIPFQRLVLKEGPGIVARNSPAASEMNPPHYTRSGWPVLLQTSSATEAVSPLKNESRPAEASPLPPSAGDNSGKINLNSATTRELESLPGIGPKTAAQIEAYREQQPFRSIEDLQQVHGIGPKKFEAVRDLITVD